MPRIRWLLIIVVTVSVIAGPVAGARGSPELSFFAPDTRFAPGEQSTLDLYVQNGGTISLGSTATGVNDRLTTARNVRIELDDDGLPFDIETTRKPVGSVPEGVTGPVSFTLAVDENAKPGDYDIPVDVDYKYTNQIAFNDPDAPVHNQREVSRTAEVTVTIEREARFRVVDTSLGTLVDDRGNLQLTIENEGRATARDARISIESHDSRLTFDSRSTTQRFVGRWEAGSTRTLTFQSTIADGTEREPLPLSFDVTYLDGDGDERTSEERTTGVTYTDRTDRFVIEAVDSSTAIGDAGTVTLTVRNTGPTFVEAVRFAVESADARLSFGNRAAAETFVGPWAPDEVKRIAFKATVASGSDVRAFPIIGTVTYRDTTGETRATDPLVAGVVPLPEQSFEARNVQSTLAVGQEGDLTGTIVNTGETTVRNAVVIFESDNPNVNAIETRYQVGTLAPADSADFSFDVEISENAGSGPRQFSVRLRYRDTEDEIRRSDQIDLNVSVGPQRDVFTVEPVAGSLAAGSSAPVTIRVTNAGDEALSDISAKVFADDPLSSDDDEAFIDELSPGESTTITIGISAAGSALEKVYPVSMDFQYTEPDGDTRLSNTYTVPIDVTTRSGGGFPVWLPIIGVLIVVAAVGYIVYRRRAGSGPR